MTREEAIKVLSSYDVNGVWADVGGKPYNAEEQAEAFDMAIEALEGVCFDEWCDDCKEYDTEKKCCPRFNRVIRGAMKREPSEDGTLEIKVEDATKIGRVLVSDDKHRGGLYYPDEYEPKGDLISRAEAINAIVTYGYTDITSVVHVISNLPSADRPRGEWANDEHDMPRCSNCGYMPEFNNHIDDYYYSDFCPNCGADMRETKGAK